LKGKKKKKKKKEKKKKGLSSSKKTNISVMFREGKGKIGQGRNQADVCPSAE